MREQDVRLARRAIKLAGTTCPSCGSDQIWLNGWIVNRDGRHQRLKCASCARIFVQVKSEMKRDMVKGMRQVVASGFSCFGDPYGGSKHLCYLINGCPKHEECFAEFKNRKKGELETES